MSEGRFNGFAKHPLAVWLGIVVAAGAPATAFWQSFGAHKAAISQLQQDKTVLHERVTRLDKQLRDRVDNIDKKYVTVREYDNALRQIQGDLSQIRMQLNELQSTILERLPNRNHP